jgi:hypothetical protein
VLICGATLFLAGGRYASERYVIQVTESGKCATKVRLAGAIRLGSATST